MTLFYRRYVLNNTPVNSKPNNKPNKADAPQQEPKKVKQDNKPQQELDQLFNDFRIIL